MKLKDAIATRVEELCKQNNLTTHGLSLKTGVANSTLANMIHAQNESIQIKHIYSICAGLDMNIKDFKERSCRYPTPSKKGFMI